MEVVWIWRLSFGGCLDYTIFKVTLEAFIYLSLTIEFLYFKPKLISIIKYASQINGKIHIIN